MGLEWGPRDRSSVMGGSRVGGRRCSTAEPSIIDRKHWLILVLRASDLNLPASGYEHAGRAFWKPLLLLGPRIRERLGEPGDGEVGRGVAIGDRRHDARRHEGERRQQADVALTE